MKGFSINEIIGEKARNKEDNILDESNRIYSRPEAHIWIPQQVATKTEPTMSQHSINPGMSPLYPSGRYNLLARSNSDVYPPQNLWTHPMGPSVDNSMTKCIDAGFVFHKFSKPKRIRTTFTSAQLIHLEKAFIGSQYVVGRERKDLAKGLGLTETQVKIWFQNRRTKNRRVQGDGFSGDLNNLTDSDEEESKPISTYNNLNVESHCLPVHQIEQMNT